jgi:hypothetical protein
MDKATAIWRGELLWPTDLPDGRIIDLSAVTVLGVWTHDWFRTHPNRAVVGGAAHLKRQLAGASVPILWYERLSEATATGGVSASEREMLWS